MFEARSDTRTRLAIENAHEARGQAMREAWRWLFGKTSR